ncbi:MAG TPA: amidohydrolase, partial [Sphingobium sp.]
MKHRLLAAIAALALPYPALASGVIDNVNGIALDATGRIVRFASMLIDDEGKVEQLLPGRYQEPPRKKKLKKGETWPKGPDFKLDAGGRTLVPGLIDG